MCISLYHQYTTLFQATSTLPNYTVSKQFILHPNSWYPVIYFPHCSSTDLLRVQSGHIISSLNIFQGIAIVTAYSPDYLDHLSRLLWPGPCSHQPQFTIWPSTLCSFLNAPSSPMLLSLCIFCLKFCPCRYCLFLLVFHFKFCFSLDGIHNS